MLPLNFSTINQSIRKVQLPQHHSTSLYNLPSGIQLILVTVFLLLVLLFLYLNFLIGLNLIYDCLRFFVPNFFFIHELLDAQKFGPLHSVHCLLLSDFLMQIVQEWFSVCPKVTENGLLYLVLFNSLLLFFFLYQGVLTRDTTLVTGLQF